MNQLPNFSSIHPVTFPDALASLLQTNLSHIETILKTNHAFNWDTLMGPLEEMKNKVEQCWSPFSHLHAVQNTPEMRTSYERCLPMLTDYETKLGQNVDLYQAICTLSSQNLSPTKRKIIADTIRNFKLAGVNLPPKEKQRYQAIETRLSELETTFENHLIDAELAFELHITDENRLQGLPEHTIQAAKARAQSKQLNGWILGIDPPCYLAVMTNATDKTLREAIYYAHITRASDVGPQAGQFDNTPIMQEILSLRHELAQLIGFDHYASLSLTTKMANDVQEVITFLMDLQQKVRVQAQAEFKTLQSFAKTQFNIQTLDPWDIAYVSEQLKQAQFSFSEESLRSYFKEGRVWATLEMILQKLYGMKMIEINGVDKWHPLVRCFQLTDTQGQLKGYLYADLFARPYKRTGAWMDSLQTHMQTNGMRQLPIATLTCNFAAPQENQEATFLHEDVITMLHELGHCLHHLLTEVNEYSAAGIHGVEWDAVELPSQFFEHWCWNQDLLMDFTSNLPPELISQLLKTKTFMTGMALLRQLEFSLFDLKLHNTTPGIHPDWIHNILAEIRKTTCLLPVMPYNRFENSFSHIFAGGYAAGYYSYLWAEILSSDCYSKFEETGILNAQTGMSFLHEILARGSSRTAKENFEAFMGRGISMDAFLRHRGVKAL
jgi:oligopeptidase A